MYPASIEETTVERILQMEVSSNPKSVYKIVKAFAETRDWSERYDLKRTVDSHIKKLKKLQRTERDILSKNDLSINDNFQQLIRDYENKVEDITSEIQSIKFNSWNNSSPKGSRKTWKANRCKIVSKNSNALISSWNVEMILSRRMFVLSMGSIVEAVCKRLNY